MKCAKSKGVVISSVSEDAIKSSIGSGIECRMGPNLGIGGIGGIRGIGGIGGIGVSDRVLVGNRSLLEAHKISLSALVDNSMWDLEIQGKTAVIVAVGMEVIGIIGIADNIKPEAKATVWALQQQGIDVWMVTGDNHTTAEAVARQVGITPDRTVAGSKPQGKVEKIIALQGEGQVVAMVGDGINDSPALAQADLGVAIGAGTQVAMEAADLVLVASQLHDLVVALHLAKVVFQRIKLNFMWALVYNLVAVPYAAGVWYPITRTTLPPQYAGLAMALSSVTVVLSSMSLRLYSPPLQEEEVVRVATVHTTSYIYHLHYYKLLYKHCPIYMYIYTIILGFIVDSYNTEECRPVEWNKRVPTARKR